MGTEPAREHKSIKLGRLLLAIVASVVVVAAVTVFAVEPEFASELVDEVNPFPRRQAIKLVQESQAPGASVLVLAGAARGQLDGTWKSYLEHAVAVRGESMDGYEWFATRDLHGLRQDEWYVGFVDASDLGHFFAANTQTGKVIHINSDLVTAHRLGHLSADTAPHLKIAVKHAGFERCESWSDKGWCWAIEGSATNTRSPIVELDAEVELVFHAGGKTIKGEGVSSSPDPFRRTSASRPWAVGETRSFKYRSRIIPEVYATSEVEGEGIVVFSTTVETLTQSKTREHLVVETFAWPSALGDLQELAAR